MSGSLLDWRAQLQPASWRGLPFLVRAETVRGGRRVAVHEYPNKDDVWPEDLGKLPRAFALEGFVVGDDCAVQRQALQDASEAEGPGELVHPTFGSLVVTLISFASSARQDMGRAYELRFEFVQGQSQQYPSAADDTGAQVGLAMDRAAAACDGDFVAAAAGAAITATSVADAVQAVQGYAAQAQSLAGDAAGVFNAVRGLVPGSGTYGRYDGGARSTQLAGISSASAAIAAANQARSAVSSACANLRQLAAGL